MSVARAVRSAGLALLVWVMLVPAAHALGIYSPRMVAAVTPLDSSWVKNPARGAAAGRESSNAGGRKGKPSAKTNAGSSVDAGALKKSNSIASELAGSKSVPWSIVLGLTLLTLLPALLLSMTPLVRLLVVFHFLRQALGTQTAPSNQILMGLALMMTWFLMQPVLLEVEQKAVTPYSAGTMTGMEALDRGIAPVKTYMLRYAREKDLAVFASAGMATRPKSKEDLPIQVVVPAYILSELKAGFQIGAVLFLPFLLVDLVVASITTSIGMMQLPPVVISTPLKILLFVMVDGWNLLADQLIKSF
jgi:flagellar biosynthetic protein FliP